MSATEGYSSSESGRPRTLGGTLSIDWKLPLLITAVLAAGLAAFLAFTYVSLSRRFEGLIRDRFAHAAQQVARSVEVAAATRADVVRRTAQGRALARALETVSAGKPLSAADSMAASADLAAALTTDSLPPLLVDMGGRVLAAAGKGLPASIRVIDPTSVAPLSSDDAPDKARLGPLTVVGNRVLFWVVAPVVGGGRRTGYVMQPRYVVGPPDAMQNLRELTREDLTVYSRNIDGTGWMIVPGLPTIAPLARDSSDGRLSYERPNQGRFIAEEARIAGTPWITVIDSPVHSLLARLRSTVEQLAWMSLVILAAGAVLAWIVGRRITRPLILLTSAADQVATGTYEQPIAIAGRDEIGRLAARFHEMAAQVTEARRELEQRASDAQHSADELAAANRRLQTTMTEAQVARAEAERARGEAEAANRAKSDFLAMMSHELRTPLNAIGGYAELIELGIHGPVTDAQRNALNRIARSQAHLLTLINDVLNFARVDAGQIQYVVEDLRMNETLASIEPLVEPQIVARNLTFQYEACDPSIIAAADGDKVRQVVLNLLGNAVKYTPEGGRVTLACEADVTHVRVHVRDTGPGIEPDQLPVIFEAFVQGHRALNRPNEGVGLGLAISRDLARGMGGDVTVDTELGVGSTFTLVLPRAGAVRMRGEPPLSTSRVASAR
jgi:signal transduction histidine kinase